jgi:hypothetical protein
LVLGLLAGFVGTAAADPTFVEARLNLRVEAQVAPDVVQWQLQSRYQTGGYADLQAATTVSDSNTHGSISTFSAAQASWASTAQGSVHFDDTGFVQAAFSAPANSNVDSSGWSYTFITGDEDTFTLNYAVASSPETDDPSSLGGFIFAVLQGGDTPYSQNLDVDTADQVVVPLSPYQTYTAVLIPVVELSGGTGLCIAAMTADFDWGISAGDMQTGHLNGKGHKAKVKLANPQHGVGD